MAKDLDLAAPSPLLRVSIAFKTLVISVGARDSYRKKPDKQFLKHAATEKIEYGFQQTILFNPSLSTFVKKLISKPVLSPESFK